MLLVAAEAALWFGHPKLRRWHLGGYSRRGPWHTNATFWSPATKALHPTGHAHAWYWQSFARRAMIRATGFLMVLIIEYGLLTAPVPTLAMLAATTLILLAYAAVRAILKARRWHHHRHYVQPLEQSIVAMVGVAPSRIQISREGKVVTRVQVGFPPEIEMGPKDQEAVLQAVTTRLPIEAPDKKWNTLGRNRTGTFTPTPSPPARVTLGDLRAAIEGSKASEIIAGQGRRNTAVPVDLHSDACHVALSIGPGGGKTFAARALAIQVLHKGGLVIVLNAKKTGYNWTRGLPNVTHAKTIDEIADTLLWVNTERKRREDVVEAAGNIEDEVPDTVKVGPRILVIFEEQNLTVPKLKVLRPEAYEALGDLNFAGRAALIHLLSIAQRYSAKAAGGGDVRAAVNARILGRYDKKAWTMLADSFPMPAMNNAPGRVQVVTDEVHEAQMPKVGGQEAHDYALSGVVALCPDTMPCRCAIGVPVSVGQVGNNGAEQGFVPGTGPDPGLPPSLVGLAAAVGDGVISLSLAAVRKRRQRDPSFPQPRGRDGAELLFDVAELIAWEERR